MEWQNEQVRFFSNSGVSVFCVGFNCKGGFLMNRFYLNDKTAWQAIRLMCQFNQSFSKRQMPSRFTRESHKVDRRKYRSLPSKETRWCLIGDKKRSDDTRFKIKVAKKKMDKYKANCL